MSLLRPVEWVIAQLLTLIHAQFVALGMPDGPGLAWCLAVMCLVVVIRVCLIPLFVWQMRGMRAMQAIGPEMQRIQRKYASRTDPRSREAMQREMMALQREHGANPLGSCVPAMIQAPILCSLYYVLQSLPAIASGAAEPLGGMGRALAGDVESSSILGVALSDSFGTAGDPASRIVIGAVVALMCVTLFSMQWILIHRNTPKDAMDSPQFRTQKMTAFVFPAIYVVSGATLPFGVLLYWMTNNLWNLAQTLVQLRLFPTPGSVAGERKSARDHARENARRVAAGLPSIEEERAAAARAVAQARRDREARRPARTAAPHDAAARHDTTPDRDSGLRRDAQPNRGTATRRITRRRVTAKPRRR
ncbi:membrane protein insertase YidC [Bifidobacterium santillanense]|nr:membrane protein insertase YidC [Bifidobacterium santillanense]